MLKSNKKNLVLNSAVVLNEHVEAEGKGRKFVSRFIEAGVAHYQEFGDILITKETLDKFINTMIGCPVIINHKDITEKNADDERVGVVSNVWYNEGDGWYYCEGIIWDKQAIDLVKNHNWNVSCTYDFESDFIEKTHNGKKIDMEFTNGKFLHLALVNNPRYERATIVMNSKENEVCNGWVTLDELDEDGNRKRIWIEGAVGQSREERKRKIEILDNYKEGQETKYDFSHTRAKLTDIQKQEIKSTIESLFKEYTGKPIAQVEVRSLGSGVLGLCTSGKNCSILALDSSLFSGKYTQQTWENGVKSGFHPKCDTKDMIKNVLVHEMGHVLSVNQGDEKFWDKIETIRKDYLKNIKKEDVKKSDFISNYARVNKYEFVAEAFAQGQLSKKTGKYTSQVMDLMNEHFGKTAQMKLIATNEEEKSGIIWEEDWGGGYPIDEEAYEKTKEKQDNKAENWNEEEHPRDKDGKFTNKTADETEKAISKDYYLSDEYKNHIQFKEDKESAGFPRKIYKDLERAKYFYNYKKENIQKADKINKRTTPVRDTPLIVKSPIGEGYIVATLGLAQKHGLEEIYPIKRKHKIKQADNKAQNGKDIFMTVLNELENFVKSIVENACDKKEKIEEKETIVENEDKRKLIDEVGGILKGKVDEEVWRTIIGKLEKIAYNPSENTKVDNKCKNEDDEKEEKEEKFEEEKEIAENKKAKKEEKEIEIEKKEKVENSMDKAREIAMGGNEYKNTSYISQKERLELGNNY